MADDASKIFGSKSRAETIPNLSGSRPFSTDKELYL